MTNKAKIEKFLDDVLYSGGEIKVPELFDKHDRPLSRESLGMYIHKIGRQKDVRFYTKTRLDGMLVVGVRS